MNSIHQSIIKHAMYNNTIFIFYRFIFSTVNLYILENILYPIFLFLYVSFSHFRKDFWMISFFISCVVQKSVYQIHTYAHTHNLVVYTTWNMQATLIVVNSDWIYTVIIFIFTRLRLTFRVQFEVNKPGHRWVAMQNNEEAKHRDK